MEIKIPAVGESITEVTLAEWKKNDGDYVNANDVLIMVETDKATVEVVAEKAGLLKIKTPAGQVVPVGAIVGELDTNASAPAGAPKAAAAAAPATVSAAPAGAVSAGTARSGGATSAENLMPAAKRLAEEKSVDLSGVQATGKGGRVLKEDVQRAMDSRPAGAVAAGPVSAGPVAASSNVVEMPRASGMTQKGSRIVPMSTLRKRIAQRLVEAKTNAAILTTFNEVDMTAYNRLRDAYGEKFKEKYGTRLGFMGLFAKACVESLKQFPQVNAFIEGDNFIFNDFYNFGIAVSTPAGLVVPVVRDVDELTVAQIELEIRRLAIKARDGKLGIDDMRGGTFTISNGGVFGSLMSTPILNPPQSGILGLHKVEDRAVVINGKVEVRPMMYVALSYDHRIIDGKESVSFLVRVKECMEDPERLLLEV